MRLRQAFEQAAQQRGDPEWSAEQVMARLFEAHQQGHRVEQPAVAGASDRVDRHDARMRKCGIRLQPLLEPIDGAPVHAVEDLDHCRPAARQVRGHVKRCRTAGHDPPDQPETGCADRGRGADVHGRDARESRPVVGSARALRNVRHDCRPAWFRRAECGPDGGLAAMEATVAIDLPSVAAFQVKLQPR